MSEIVDKFFSKKWYDDPLCRCTEYQGPHARCLVHRNMVCKENISPEYQAYVVANRLLGSPERYCQVCGVTIHRHSTGNYFHLTGFHNHKAVA